VTQIACPSCAATMDRRTFERRPFGSLDLDLCFACHAIWFDQYESAQLTPGAVLELFREIHAHGDDPQRPLGDVARCPACHEKLRLTQDFQRSTRISYYRCESGHGRLTTFFQFLREKNFVRTLTPPEVAQLRLRVDQVRCSSCGAPIDLAHDSQCAYCRAPISILDADAVRRTVAELGQAEQARQRVDPAAAVDGVLAGRRFERKLARIEGRTAVSPAWVAGAGLVDLVSEALGLFLSE
jgi:ferredoxin